MKKIGRDRDYKQALSKNLVRNLKLNGSITTTQTKGRNVARDIVKTQKGTVTVVPLGKRRGDGAMMVKVTWKSLEKEVEPVVSKNEKNKKQIKPKKIGGKTKASSKEKDTNKK